jgi:hypothetical protein
MWRHTSSGPGLAQGYNGAGIAIGIVDGHHGARTAYQSERNK